MSQNKALVMVIVPSHRSYIYSLSNKSIMEFYHYQNTKSNSIPPILRHIAVKISVKHPISHQTSVSATMNNCKVCTTLFHKPQHHQAESCPVLLGSDESFYMAKCTYLLCEFQPRTHTLLTCPRKAELLKRIITVRQTTIPHDTRQAYYPDLVRHVLSLKPRELNALPLEHRQRAHAIHHDYQSVPQKPSPEAFSKLRALTASQIDKLPLIDQRAIHSLRELDAQQQAKVQAKADEEHRFLLKQLLTRTPKQLDASPKVEKLMTLLKQMLDLTPDQIKSMPHIEQMQVKILHRQFRQGTASRMPSRIKDVIEHSGMTPSAKWLKKRRQPAKKDPGVGPKPYNPDGTYSPFKNADSVLGSPAKIGAPKSHGSSSHGSVTWSLASEDGDEAPTSTAQMRTLEKRFGQTGL
ncbi:hypothetical protein BT63DRAFT_180402 [Microthyrium microscopicum]|uniref:Uncharacterized protein n=1 Tax=Microthyrium microscopicum TaxID=703497 RepID=A0A6A6UJZ7_9PEZI|nr:hypothetical protein BT63DRAFT_180402 [Microthyrium microscopicum]